jgi:tetratricopeptide (TPR) repeat protein
MYFAHSKESSLQNAPGGGLAGKSVKQKANLNYDVGPAISESSNSKEGCIALGKANQRDGLIVAAICDWKNAVVIDPNCGQAWLLLGEAYVHLRQPRDAVACYKKALLLKPPDVPVESIKEKVAKLQEEIRQEEADPLWANCNFFNERVRLVTGPSDLGINRQISSGQTKSLSENANGEVAEAVTEAEKKGDYQQAVKLYEEILKANPSNAKVVMSLAVALELLGRFEEAISRYEEAMRLVPKNADAMVAIGDIHSISLGDDKTALYWYAKAIQNSDDPEKKKAIAHRIGKFMLDAGSR